MACQGPNLDEAKKFGKQVGEALLDELITNEPMFNGWDADIIILDHKIAILWNGKWHYSKITKKHSVSQVQTRDKIKLDEIRKMGYDVYTIRDEGRENIQFVNEEFRKFVLFIDNRLCNITVI